MVSEDEMSFDSFVSKCWRKNGHFIIFMEGEKHIRDSVLPPKQPSNAFSSLPLAPLGKQGNQKRITSKVKDLLIGSIKKFVWWKSICRVLQPSGIWPFGCTETLSRRTWVGKSTNPVSTLELFWILKCFSFRQWEIQAVRVRNPRLHLHLSFQRGDPAHHR